MSPIDVLFHVTALSLCERKAQRNFRKPSTNASLHPRSKFIVHSLESETGVRSVRRQTTRLGMLLQSHSLNQKPRSPLRFFSLWCNLCNAHSCRSTPLYKWTDDAATYDFRSIADHCTALVFLLRRRVQESVNVGEESRRWLDSSRVFFFGSVYFWSGYTRYPLSNVRTDSYRIKWYLSISRVIITVTMFSRYKLGIRFFISSNFLKETRSAFMH